MLFGGTPRSLADVSRLYADDSACASTIHVLRSDVDPRCPGCGSRRRWEAGRHRSICPDCLTEWSDTVGTLLHRNRIPLPALFLATWLASTTRGINALSLARQAGVSERTAWRLLGLMRQAMSASLTDALSGVVEADEAFLGRKEHQSTVVVLVEARKDGRVRMGVVPGQTMAVLTPFIADRVEPGGTIRTDGWKGYSGLERAGFIHERVVHAPGWVERGERSTPYADEAISAVKRWMLATYQKPPTPENLDAYLAEFCFRREFRDPGAAFEALLRGLVTPR